MEKEYVDHFIKLDDMMELKMKIPVQLNVLELKALMYKADKLFKLSEVKIMQHKIAGQKRSDALKDRKQNVYSKKVVYDLVNLKKRKVPIPKIAEFLNEKYGSSQGLRVSPSQLHSRWHYQKRADNIENYYDSEYEMPERFSVIARNKKAMHKTTKKYQRMEYTPEMEQFIIDLHNQGAKGLEITDKFNKKFNTNLIRRKIVDKVKSLKFMGKLGKGAVKKKEIVGSHLYPPDVELVMIQLANDGHSSKDIRDAVNSQFSQRYSKKQVTDKIYNLKKQGRVTE